MRRVWVAHRARAEGEGEGEGMEGGEGDGQGGEERGRERNRERERSILTREMVQNHKNHKAQVQNVPSRAVVLTRSAAIACPSGLSAPRP